MTIVFEPQCRILVGINESGKTNILKALALLDSKIDPTREDIRDFPPDENPDEEAYVRFMFAFDKHERETIFQNSKLRILSDDSKLPILALAGSSFTVHQICDTRNEGLYIVDLRKRVKFSSSWQLASNYRVLPGWAKPSGICPKDYAVVRPDGSPVPLHSFSLVQRAALPLVDPSYLEDLTVEDINLLFHEPISALVKKSLPECIFWAYSEDNLLPAQINLDSFAADPKTCAPLQHMFTLAGIEKVEAAILDAKLRQNGMRNLLNRVADRATKHMHAVWKEYRYVSIELALNGTNIEATVKDSYNVYDFARRSDGFKRFVTFLLMVSARARTDQLVDTLYLHDEPDISLHPSGARYLRDELIKIARTNNVVFSTHSIFMIDRELLRRHLIVEKKDEISTIREVDDSNIVDEEVIYNSLGYSIFESLRPFNIIFEGWRDKRLFQVATQQLPTGFKFLKKTFTKIGVCHARGVKDVGRITPLLELAGRQWIVLSDGDRPAVEHQKLYDGAGRWLRYDELIGGPPVAITGEDFLKPGAFKKILKEIASEYSILATLPPPDLTTSDTKLSVIKEWLKQGEISGDLLKETLNRLKERVFAELKPSDIADKYYELLKVLAEHVA